MQKHQLITSTEEFLQLEFSFPELSLQESVTCIPADEVAVAYTQKQAKHSPLRVRDLPESERPRTRLIDSGAGSLSNSELLTVLLGSGQGGSGGLSSMGLAEKILYHLAEAGKHPLESLKHVTAHELMSIHGIGEAKAASILAAVELGKRAYTIPVPPGTVIDSPSDAASVLACDLMYQQVEKFAIVMLDTRNRLIGKKIISVGTATETFACPREVFQTLLKHGATRAIVAHCHPSGDTQSSEDDIQITRNLLQVSQVMNLPILDHLILGKGTFTSIRQTSGLWYEFPQKE